MNSPRRALIVVDVQYDFLPLGSLAVPNSDEVLKPIYKLLESHSTWSLIIASQDYHPHNHISFASRYPGESPFTKIKINNSAEEQDLWPTHCVQETKGSEIEEGIMERLLSNKAKIVRKGTEIDKDAYSAFHSIESTPNTVPKSLVSVLKESDIEEIYVVGLATDYCVKATTLDALKEAADSGKDWKVFVIEEAVRGVDIEASKRVLKELEVAGAKIIGIDELKL